MAGQDAAMGGTSWLQGQLLEQTGHDFKGPSVLAHMADWHQPRNP
jgi:hypothetical protein